MRWDGSSWETIPSPNVESAQAHILSDVACVTPSDCWAVGSLITGSFRVRTLVMRWDGTSWEMAEAPEIGSDPWNGLNDVTCVSASECWAAGFNTTGTASTLIMRWDGSTWELHDSPNPGAQGNVLHGVTCVSASDCWAVGSSSSDAAAKHTLALHWDGAAWEASASADALGAQESVLSGVTCVSTSDCWAVGHSFNGVNRQSLIERWDGNAWTAVVSPNEVGPLDTYLSRVDCSSATDCWAVGYSNDSTTIDQHYILRWDGALWTPAALPDPLGGQASVLADISCLSASDCWAMGSVTTGTARSFLLRWDGETWNTVPSPEVSLPEESHGYLHDVTCVAEDDCWAVGFYFSGQVARSLFMRWDGSSWNIVDSPNVDLDRNNYLDSVTCTSSSNCWAVGRHTTTAGTEGQTLILHWDGTAWSIVPSFPADTSAVQSNALTGVSCVSESECVAVGHSVVTGTQYRAIAMHWDGVSWTVDPVPPREDAETFYVPSDLLYDVSCAGPSNCWAAGAHWSGTLYRTLTMHWDGSRWTPVTSPNAEPDRGNILSGVECVSTDDCWAVGSADEYEHGLIEHWDGTSWTIVPSPQNGANLNDVTCVSASDCWAAGPYYTPNQPAQALLARWDGTAWTEVASPGNRAQSRYLAGIACATASDCWAVGRHSSGSKTLTVRYTPRDNGPQNKVTELAITGATKAQYSDVTLFEARLTDANGAALATKQVTFSLVGDGSTRDFSAVTDGDGIASFTPTVTEAPGTYELRAMFAGSEGFGASSDLAAFVVEKEGSAVELEVRGQGSSKTLHARLADLDAPWDGISGRTIYFYSDSVLIGSTQTGTNGVATMSIPAAHRGAKRVYEAVFSGDDFYGGSSVSNG
jgi:hypothetical protein